MKFILDRLAIGSYEEAKNPSSDISALLNVANERDIEDTGLLYHKIPIIDMQPIPTDKMIEAVEWIKDHIAQHKIMVFCNAGIGRSPSVVVGYLCCYAGYSFGKAVEFVAEKKPDISTLPNLISTIEDTKKSQDQLSKSKTYLDLCIARCPFCNTYFSEASWYGIELSSDLECGKCGETFNASDNLTDRILLKIYLDDKGKVIKIEKSSI